MPLFLKKSKVSTKTIPDFNLFKDIRKYDSHENVHPPLIDNIPPFSAQEIKVRVPRKPLPPLRGRHSTTERKDIIVGHHFAEHLVSHYRNELQAKAFREKPPLLPPLLLTGRPSITEVKDEILNIPHSEDKISFSMKRSPPPVMNLCFFSCKFNSNFETSNTRSPGFSLHLQPLSFSNKQYL